MKLYDVIVLTDKRYLEDSEQMPTNTTSFLKIF